MQHAVVPLIGALRYMPEGHRFITDNVIGNFHWHKPSYCIIAIGSNQLPTEMSTRNISWGVNVASAWGWQTYKLHVQIVLKSGKLNLLKPQGLSRPYRDSFTFTFYTHICTVTPQFYIPIFCVFCNLKHFLYGLGQMPMRTIFPRFDNSFKWCQQKDKIGVLLHTHIHIYMCVCVCVCREIEL